MVSFLIKFFRVLKKIIENSHFSIYSNILVSAKAANGNVRTQTARISSSVQTIKSSPNTHQLVQRLAATKITTETVNVKLKAALVHLAKFWITM